MCILCFDDRVISSICVCCDIDAVYGFHVLGAFHVVCVFFCDGMYLGFVLLCFCEKRVYEV